MRCVTAPIVDRGPARRDGRLDRVPRRWGTVSGTVRGYASHDTACGRSAVRVAPGYSSAILSSCRDSPTFRPARSTHRRAMRPARRSCARSRWPGSTGSTRFPLLPLIPAWADFLIRRVLTGIGHRSSNCHANRRQHDSSWHPLSLRRRPRHRSRRRARSMARPTPWPGSRFWGSCLPASVMQG